MKKLFVVLLIILLYSINSFAFKMAAMGNSISAGVWASSSFVDKKTWKHKLAEKPRYNFATGDKVNSHCSRLNADFGNFECRNFAISGSKIEDLYFVQLPRVLEYNPDYVVIEIGSNNVCADTPLTPLMFYHAMLDIAAELHRDGRLVVVVGIPDVTYLSSFANKRGILGLKAKALWKFFEHCEAILLRGENRTQLTIEYNNSLRKVSEAYGFYFAENVANMKFDTSLISKIDFFHPNRKAHELLASLSYPFLRGQQ